MKEEYNVEEQFVKIQYKLLDKGYPLERHLETVQKLPTEMKLRHYEKLFKEERINQKQYFRFLLENNPLLLQ